MGREGDNMLWNLEMLLPFHRPTVSILVLDL